MSARNPLWLGLLAAAACSDLGGGPADAPRADATIPAVTEVTCPTAPAATFTTGGAAFIPKSATVGQGQTVKFESLADHPIGPFPDPSMTDPALAVGETKTKCFRFDRAGTFKFICMHHFYLGTLTVN
jgi:plastocyanin